MFGKTASKGLFTPKNIYYNDNFKVVNIFLNLQQISHHNYNNKEG